MTKTRMTKVRADTIANVLSAEAMRPMIEEAHRARDHMLKTAKDVYYTFIATHQAQIDAMHPALRPRSVQYMSFTISAAGRGDSLVRCWTTDMPDMPYQLQAPIEVSVEEYDDIVKADGLNNQARDTAYRLFHTIKENCLTCRYVEDLMTAWPEQAEAIARASGGTNKVPVLRSSTVTVPFDAVLAKVMPAALPAPSVEVAA